MSKNKDHYRLDEAKRKLLQASALGAAGIAINKFFPFFGGDAMAQDITPDLIVHNGKITTLDSKKKEVTAVAISQGRILATGTDRDILKLSSDDTKVIDLNKRRVIPGLNDSHTHLIRGGLNYNMELRWEGVPSVAIALEMLKKQADKTPAPQWVRVVGGWSEFQFEERRMPTLEEINKAAPDTPVFILHLYGQALLNQAAIRTLGIDKDTPNPPGGVIEKDSKGNPTGLLVAKPSALILYSTLARGPVLPEEYQYNSSRHYMREMNRLGITSVIDAGGGGQNYPEDYKIIRQLHENGEMTVRVAYNLFAQNKGGELEDYKKWTGMVSPGQGDDLLWMNGAGENLTWSAADFENFLEPRPTPEPVMEEELEAIVRVLVENRWPFRIHATYDETIERFLAVFERVNLDIPFNGLRFIIDHAETISDKNIERVKALGGGIAVQHRMAFQGEYFVNRYGADAAKETPPIKKMLEMGVPVGGGTDATRVASYNPFVSLYWMITGKTLGGLDLYDESNQLDRETALYLWTKGSSWFSGEDHAKGALIPGEYADLAVLSGDLMNIDEEEIKSLTSVLTIMGGNVVYAADEFSGHNPPLPPVMPNWSPVNEFGGYYQKAEIGIGGAETSLAAVAASSCGCSNTCNVHGHDHGIAWTTPLPIADQMKKQFWGAIGCSCFAAA
ncbi:amidohydrolase [Curvivirga aplysinae]|uniref:amidohydrolase n=1 Tax=Curvivirga aplysinae TaxID=2529852 RepID=UPI0012BBF015|nr:amidohydrolase [Curvivirga aplysinae]MTI09942.1 amidohydrolase [Curvivirga aplysinae]